MEPERMKKVSERFTNSTLRDETATYYLYLVGGILVFYLICYLLIQLLCQNIG